MGQVVMMIDDDEVFLEELGQVLSSNGYKTVAVSDPKKAMETAQKIRPDLILLDLKMPGKNGFELTFEFRSKTDFANIPVIAMTGFFRHSRIPLAELSGIRKCLVKPLDPSDVISTVAETLAEGQTVFDESFSRGTDSEGNREKQSLSERFDDLLMEMAGDIDLPALSEMSDKIKRLKDYKECMSNSLARPEFCGISKNIMGLRYETSAS